MYIVTVEYGDDAIFEKFDQVQNFLKSEISNGIDPKEMKVYKEMPFYVEIIFTNPE